MKNRLFRLDELRGLTLISMILYHFMWDLKYIAGYDMPWYTGPLGNTWQRSICITFMLVSGFSFHLGRNHLKRAITVFLSGALVSAVTLIALPENRIIFGILTFIGSVGLIAIPYNKLSLAIEKLLDSWTYNLTMSIMNVLLFSVFYRINFGYLNVFFTKITLPRYLFKGYASTFLGFTDPTFYSTDYFSVFPWIFIYLLGYHLYKICCLRRESDGTIFIDSTLNGRLSAFLSKRDLDFLGYIGKHTLPIYLLHQPILYAITLLIMQFR